MLTVQQICSVVGSTPCWRAFWRGCVPTVNCRNLRWGGGACGMLARTGFGLRHSRALAAGAPESKPLCCAQPFLLPIQSLMQTRLQQSCPGTKKMMPVGHHPVCFRAENGIRTRGPQLGKLIALKFLEFEITN